MRKIVLICLLLVTACATPGTPSSYFVFFNANSSALTPEAATSINDAANAIRRHKPAMVVIAAGAAVDRNLQLAKSRYAAVRQALEAKGVAPSLIAQASLPSGGVVVSETGAQRVEIILGDNSPR